MRLWQLLARLAADYRAWQAYCDSQQLLAAQLEHQADSSRTDGR